jgi:hypothetical protein
VKGGETGMGFLKGVANDFHEVQESLLALRRRFVPELTSEDLVDDPKLVWKTKWVYQCFIRRMVEGADGVRAAWNAGNLLTIVTMARSLIETAAIARHLTDLIKDAIETRDGGALDNAVKSVLFAARHKLFENLEDASKARSILTYIDRMDRSVFHDNKGRLRDSYDYLSEFVHPNHLGILGLYADPDNSSLRIEFGKVARRKKEISLHIGQALGMIWLMELEAVEIDTLLPEIAKLRPQNS